jgi:large subunit ribosomal protein L35
MPKLKTKKALVKKIKLTKKGKIFRRKTGQNHYNSKETGKAGREKKKSIRLSRCDEKNFLKGLPYTNNI